MMRHCQIFRGLPRVKQTGFWEHIVVFFFFLFVGFFFYHFVFCIEGHPVFLKWEDFELDKKYKCTEHSYVGLTLSLQLVGFDLTRELAVAAAFNSQPASQPILNYNQQKKQSSPLLMDLCCLVPLKTPAISKGEVVSVVFIWI